VDLAFARKWPQAIVLLQQILKEDPGMFDVWGQLASFSILSGRFEQAIDAYKHQIELQPSEPHAYLNAAAAMQKLGKYDDARAHAELAAKLGADRHDSRVQALAHQRLARLALIRGEVEAAREQARLAEQADPTVPMVAFVNGRILYDAGHYEQALPLFEQAIAALNRPGSTQISELHYFAGDSLGRLERYPEAEAEFKQELRYFPQDLRARSGLAMVYQAAGRPDDVARAVADMIRVVPTPESYALGVRLWTMFGNPQKADALRTEARRTFAEASRQGARRRH